MKPIRTITFLLAMLSVFMAVPMLHAADEGATAGAAGAAAVAPAFVPANPNTDPAGVALQVFEAVQKGNWKFAASLVLIALMVIGRKTIGSKIPFFATHFGGIVMNLLLSFVGSISIALAASKKIDLNVVISALTMAGLAAGGWHAVFKQIPWINSPKPPEDKPAAAEIKP
ncbi:MAG: hypothetical protein A2Y38_16400 [Spirochaetes bacterium GWB1_59_5]|nr:MAG: hypothetical protein A2Y38_16400 [Spirochaetes bacterium GWB1_59_5]